MKGDDGWSVNVCFSCLGGSDMCGSEEKSLFTLRFVCMNEFHRRLLLSHGMRANKRVRNKRDFG